MNILLNLPRLPILLLAVILSSTVFLTSCNSDKKQAASQYATNGSYATYPSDGHYNPYPTGSKPAPTSATNSQFQEYTEAPPPPSQPKKSSTTASTTSTKKKKSPTTGTSTSKTASTTKKKSTDSTTKSKTTSPASGTTYIVKQSETLYGIAHKNHVTVSKLKSVNNLTSDIIHPGMKLKIP